MTATTRQPRTDEFDERLDQLIPPSTHPVKALSISMAVVGIAVVLTVLTITGRLFPRPAFGASFSSSSYLEVDTERNAMLTTIMLPNSGARSVRITDIELDAPGADLVDVGVMLEPLSFSVDSSSVDSNSGATPWTPVAERALPLPVTVAPGQWAELVVWFRPTECEDHSGPWGIARTTVDFGDEAFPPFSHTFTIVHDPIAMVGFG